MQLCFHRHVQKKKKKKTEKEIKNEKVKAHNFFPEKRTSSIGGTDTLSKSLISYQ